VGRHGLSHLVLTLSGPASEDGDIVGSKQVLSAREVPERMPRQGRVVAVLVERDLPQEVEGSELGARFDGPVGVVEPEALVVRTGLQVLG